MGACRWVGITTLTASPLPPAAAGGSHSASSGATTPWQSGTTSSSGTRDPRVPASSTGSSARNAASRARMPARSRDSRRMSMS
jgi:hypothetical protein